MRDETKRMFFEDERRSTCPNCGAVATYCDIADDGDDVLLDVLNCGKCGLTWERVYKYAWSRRVEE